jgi:DNA-binding beta-propeller fold protein YncE
VPDSPVTTGDDPRTVAFSPTGDLLATADEEGSEVSLFSVGGTVVAPLGTPTIGTGTGTRPETVLFNPAGNLLTVVDGEGDSLLFYPVSGTTVAPDASSVSTGADTDPLGRPSIPRALCLRMPTTGPAPTRFRCLR